MKSFRTLARTSAPSAVIFLAMLLGSLFLLIVGAGVWWVDVRLTSKSSADHG